METDSTKISKTTKCLNCGTTFQGKHCPECGQTADTQKFTMKLVLTNLIEAIWGVNGKLWTTLKGLFTQPGKMTLDFLEGKRINYYSPFSMLLKALTLYILILSFTGGFAYFNTVSVQNIEEISSNASMSERIQNGLDILFIKFVRIFCDKYTLFYLLTIPLYVVAARTCFGKNNRKRYNWAEYIIAMINPMVIVILFRCAIKLMHFILPPLSDLMSFFIPPIIVVLAISACFKEMMGFNKAKTIWRSFLTVTLYYLMVFVIIFISVIVAAFVLAIKYH